MVVGRPGPRLLDRACRALRPCRPPMGRPTEPIGRAARRLGEARRVTRRMAIRGHVAGAKNKVLEPVPALVEGNTLKLTVQPEPRAPSAPYLLPMAATGVGADAARSVAAPAEVHRMARRSEMGRAELGPLDLASTRIVVMPSVPYGRHTCDGLGARAVRVVSTVLQGPAVHGVLTTMALTAVVNVQVRIRVPKARPVRGLPVGADGVVLLRQEAPKEAVLKAIPTVRNVGKAK